MSLHGDGSFTYTPGDGYSSDDEFSYVTTDGKRGLSNVAHVTIQVGGAS